MRHDSDTLSEIFNNFIINKKDKTTYDFRILYIQQNNNDSAKSNDENSSIQTKDANTNDLEEKNEDVEKANINKKQKGGNRKI